MCAVNMTEKCAIVASKISLFKDLSVAFLFYFEAMIKEVSTYFSLFKSKSPGFTSVADVFL
jgi:hypothetical protein